MFSSFCVIFFFEVWLCLSVIKKSKKKKKELERKNKRFSFDSLRIFEKNQNCVKIFKFVSFSLFLILFFFFFPSLLFEISFFILFPVKCSSTHRSHASVTFNSHYSNPRFPFFRSAIRACVLFYYAGDNIF